VIENKDNFNYSRGLLFALAIPYYHMGARIGYAVNDKVSLTGFLVNGWNDVKDNNKAKTVGGSLTLKPSGKATIIANYLVGNEQADDADGGTRNLFDLVVNYAATPKLTVLGNFDYGHDKVTGDGVDWSGVAIGVKYQASDKWAFSPRYEYFADSDGFATGTDQDLQEITLTGEYKAPAGLLARVEFRTDFSDQKFFVKDSGSLSKTQPTLTFALIYAFSNK
jgi:putative OmpL-like beta-barrel porin-2